MTKKKRQRKPARKPAKQRAVRKKVTRKKTVRKAAKKKAVRKTSKRAATKKKVVRKKKTRMVVRRKPAAKTAPGDDPDALNPFEDALHEGEIPTRTDLLIDPEDLEAVRLEASARNDETGSTRQDTQTEAAPQTACPDSKKTPIQRDESRGAALSSSDPTQEADAREPETRDLTDDDPTQTECFDGAEVPPSPWPRPQVIPP